jgi:serine O-acetyltransferase
LLDGFFRRTLALESQERICVEPPEVSPWDTIQVEAAELIEKEPLLRNLVSRLVCKGGTLQQALAIRLADLLQAPGVRAADLADLFAEIVSGNPTIAICAARDLEAVRTRDPACETYLHALINFKGFQALQAHRIAHRLWLDERTELASWISNRASLVLGPDIHPAARIGLGIMLDHGSGIVIGETAVVESDVSILQNVTLGGTGKTGGDRHPKVRQGVMIGAGAKVIGNIEIGEFSKVAAGSVVLKSVPPHCTVAGVPAQIVRIHNAAAAPAISMDQSI